MEKHDMQRKFLGWNRPLLPATADYLFERFAQDGRLDLQRVVLALPGRRAANRLEELLARGVECRADRGELDPAWYPPEFLTLGTLPERFYALKRPIADDLTQYSAWLRVVDRVEEECPDLLHTLIPRPPRRDDPEARLALGKMLATLHRELAADALDFRSVEALCEKLKVEHEAGRWNLLATLQKKYLELLDSVGIWDLQSARLFAINEQAPEERRRILDGFRADDRLFFLVGLVDMNRAQKRILEPFTDFVTPLVFAPESLAERFDEFGCLVPGAWSNAEIRIDDDRIHLVERPENQADTVLRQIAELKGRYGAAEIVLGVPDPRVVPFLRQRLEQAGIESRHFEGIPMRRTAVYRLLETVLAFFKSRSFTAFAELVRHPDVEYFLRDDPAWKAADAPVDILSQLDRYHAEFLPTLIEDDEHARPGPASETLRTILLRLKELSGVDFSNPESSTNREHPSAWTKLVTAMLDRLDENDERREGVEARKLVAGAVETLLGMPESLQSKLSLPETIEMLLILLRSGNIPPHENPEAVELIGWLEIVMDDAPVAMVTGMNDGFVPSFLTSDMFLPDKVRSELGIEDNRRRYARDAYALSVILETRRRAADDSGAKPAAKSKRESEPTPGVQLIGSRRSSDGEPMLPSRLFFATDSQTVAQRVRRFFGPMPPEPALVLVGTTLPGRTATSAFRVPEPEPVGESVRSMRVTEFADYLRCPYRYYLRHRLRLESLRDGDEELDAKSFGNLIHDVLNEFASSDVGDSTSPEAIFRFLESALSDISRRRYGFKPRPAVALQFERARKRLEAFAEKQADWRREGYAIHKTEFAFDDGIDGRKIALETDVDGRSVLLRGRIDRIDRHEETGRWFVLDYKTSDTAVDLEKMYRKKNPEGVMEWIDFQLPLYHYILRQAGFSGDIGLGHVSLPRDTAKTAFHSAEWAEGDIDEAVDRAQWIASQILRNQFPKTNPPPPFSEAFAAVCMDDVLK